MSIRACRWRTWATRSASARRRCGQARRPTRRRRASAAPSSSAARSGVAVGERQPGNAGQAQGHERGAAGRARSGPALSASSARASIEAAAQHIQDAQLYSGTGGEPVTPGQVDQVAYLAQRRQGVVVAAERRVHRAGRELGYRCEDGLVLAAWNSSSETITSRSAPSKSPVIGKIHAIASWAAACRKGSWTPGSSTAEGRRGPAKLPARRACGNGGRTPMPLPGCCVPAGQPGVVRRRAPVSPYDIHALAGPGVRITVSSRGPWCTSPPSSGVTTQVCNQPPRPASPARAAGTCAGQEL